MVKVYLMRHEQDRALGRPISGRGLAVNKRVSTEVRIDGVNQHLTTGPTQKKKKNAGNRAKKQNKQTINEADSFNVQCLGARELFPSIPFTLGLF